MKCRQKEIFEIFSNAPLILHSFSLVQHLLEVKQNNSKTTQSMHMIMIAQVPAAGTDVARILCYWGAKWWNLVKN